MKIIIKMGLLLEKEKYRDNLEKDLEHQYNVLTPIINQQIDKCFGEVADWYTDPNCSDDFFPLKKAIELFKFVIPNIMVSQYDYLIHSVLFKKWNWEEDKQKLIDNNALLDNRVSTSDLFDILIRVNRDATNVLIDKLQSCPPGELELLKKALYDGDKQLFVDTFNRLNCDFSILYFFANTITLYYDYLLGFFSSPEAWANLVYHTDMGYYTELMKERFPTREEFEASMQGDSAKHSITYEEYIEEAKQRVEEGLVKVISVVVELKNETKKELRDCPLYPFEEKYIDIILKHPDIEPLLEKIPTPQATSKLVDVESEEQKPLPPMVTDEPQWPTDEELKNYPNNYNDAEYFTNTIFGPAGKVDLVGVEKLFAILVKQGILKDDIETKLVFLARYSGKEIPGITLKPIEWDMLSSDREAAMGYLIYMTTTNHEFVKGKRFFYFNFNGVKKAPDDRLISSGGTRWANRGPQSKARTQFEIKLGKFLQEYQGEGEE